MWSCKKCDTINEEDRGLCSLCGALRTETEAAPQKAGGKPQTGANYRYASAADRNARVRTEGEAKTAKTSGIKILAIALGVLLVVAVGVIVFLMSRSPVPIGAEAASSLQNAAQAPSDTGSNGSNPSAGGSPSAPTTQTVCGDVTLTVEPHGHYTANIIPTDAPIHVTNMPMDGITYQSDTVQFCVTDCSLINTMGIAMGHQPVAGAAIQLTYLDTGDTWNVVSGADGGCAPIAGLAPGAYVYTISCEGYESFSSNSFYLEQPSGSTDEIAGLICSLVPTKSVFSNGFSIQLTDLNGNPIANKAFGSILVYTCDQEGQQYFTRGGIYIGQQTDELGIIIDDQNIAGQCSVRKGAITMIVIDGVAVWGDTGVTDQYIIIRAE